MTSSQLLPREHGAYAQLAFPLLTGLALARFAPGALAFAVGVVSVFLAHEPVAILAGVRGPRLRDKLAAAAHKRLAFLGGAAILALVAAAGLAPGRAWLAAGAPAVLAAPLASFFGRRAIKSVAGEMLVAGALSALVLPLALTTPVTWARAGTAALVWMGAYLPAVLAVHAVKARHLRRARHPWTLWATPVAAAIVVVAALVAAALLPWPALTTLAVLPPALAVLAIGLAPPHPRHLKRIGWAMVAADTLALVLVLAL